MSSLVITDIVKKCMSDYVTVVISVDLQRERPTIQEIYGELERWFDLDDIEIYGVY